MPAMVQPISFICLYNSSRSNLMCHSTKSAAMIIGRVLFASKKALETGEQLLILYLIGLLLMGLWEDSLYFSNQCPDSMESLNNLQSLREQLLILHNLEF